MVLPDAAAAAAVPPQGEDLPDHCHPAQCAVGQFQDLRVADLLQGHDTLEPSQKGQEDSGWTLLHPEASKQKLMM